MDEYRSWFSGLKGALSMGDDEALISTIKTAVCIVYTLYKLLIILS